MHYSCHHLYYALQLSSLVSCITVVIICIMHYSCHHLYYALHYSCHHLYYALQLSSLVSCITVVITCIMHYSCHHLYYALHYSCHHLYYALQLSSLVLRISACRLMVLVTGEHTHQCCCSEARLEGLRCGTGIFTDHRHSCEQGRGAIRTRNYISKGLSNVAGGQPSLTTPSSLCPCHSDWSIHCCYCTTVFVVCCQVVLCATAPALWRTWRMRWYQQNLILSLRNCVTTSSSHGNDEVSWFCSCCTSAILLYMPLTLIINFI